MVGRTTAGGAAAALLALGVLTASCDGSGDASPVTDRFRPLAEAVEEERVTLGASGVAIAIVEKGEVTFAAGFGTKSTTGTAHVATTTLFRIGSSGKMLTALAVLKAVEAGLVDLDDPVTRHVPAFHLNRTPEAVAEIKVRHLLSHTSGLADYAATSEAADDPDAALEAFFTGRYAAIGYCASPPGALFAYSNPGFELAGLVAQRATKTPYRTLMREAVFAPLGMNRTFFLASEVMGDGDYAIGAHCVATDAQCSEPELGPVVRPDSYDNPWSWPAGFEWSSALDMAKLGRFLVDGDARVLRDDLWERMTSPQVSTRDAGDLVRYGFGTYLTAGTNVLDPTTGARRWYDVPGIAHDGDIPGFASTFYCLPEQRFCFVALANASEAHFSKSLEVAIRTLVEFPTPGTMPDITPRPERYPAYAGTYVDRFEIGEIRITTAGSKLFIEVPALDARRHAVRSGAAAAHRRQLPLHGLRGSQAADVHHRLERRLQIPRSRPNVAVRVSP